MLWSNVQQDDGADCVAQEDHSTAHVANSASLNFARRGHVNRRSCSANHCGHAQRAQALGELMTTVAPRRAHPFAPLVLDDAGSLEAMAAAVMRLHSTLMAVGAAIRPTPRATVPHLSLDASSPYLQVHSVRYSANRRPIASQTSLTRSPTWPSTWSRTTSLRTATNAPALSLRCPS